MLRKVEKYEILEEIGHGGMATVYRARDSRLDRMVAVKIMHPHLRAAREARIRFAREARSVARLQHDNILEIYDYSGEDSDESYIAAELLTGPTLKAFAEANPELPPEIAAAFVIQLARALGAAHEAGIIHRDVKPENALIHENRCVKLTDFGIAQMVDSQSFTATGQILGSPGHMAPEQVEGEDCDVRSDLFSLGTVLYYLAVGQLPYAGRNPHQILKKIVDGDYPDPIRMRPSIGGRLKRIIDRSLERDPNNRYQSAQAFEDDLREFVAEIGITDADELLRRYLADPPTVSDELRLRAIEHLIPLGEKAMKRGEVPVALDYFNRVLSLDETNQRVLSLVDRMGRSDSRRSLVMVSGIALGVLGVAAMGFAAYRAFMDGHSDAERRRGGSVASPIDAAIVAETDRDASVDAERTFAAEADSGARDARTAFQPPRRIVRPRGDGERTVEFQPMGDVRNFTISIDGAPARDYGPPPGLFRIDLPPGAHTFRFVGAEDCCEGTVEAEIPPGPGVTKVPAQMAFRPARLLVHAFDEDGGGVPADVQVSGGKAEGVTGRSYGLIPVPVGAVEERRSITVTADGFHRYTDDVMLRAGRIVELRVQLEAAGSAP